MSDTRNNGPERRLFEQIPLYLEFFGYGKVTAEQLRAVAALI